MRCAMNEHGLATARRLRIVAFVAGALVACGWAFGCLVLLVHTLLSRQVDPLKTPEFYLALASVPLALLVATLLLRRAPRIRACVALVNLGFAASGAICLLAVILLVFSLGW